ncbi:hypothetical protein [Klebsiella sp. CN_Kp100]|uniref:hypothetical protein n=1 Tax=Klebsiella sp. CN_Kp100 TaxID=3153422 RepID=UPI00294578D8|nr:hypothetical protein [Klebsiella oxytoca]
MSTSAVFIIASFPVLCVYLLYGDTLNSHCTLRSLILISEIRISVAETIAQKKCHRLFNIKLTMAFWHCRTGAFARRERALFSGDASDGFLMRVSAWEALCAGDPRSEARTKKALRLQP